MAEQAEAEWEQTHDADGNPLDGATVEELVRPSFRDRLARARSTFSGYVGSILSRTSIDAETWDELEEALIRADVGVGPAQELLDAVRATVKERGLTTSEQLHRRRQGGDEGAPGRRRSTCTRADTPPTVWLFVGVNGVGKTTTIGKLGRRVRPTRAAGGHGRGRHVPGRGGRAARHVGRPLRRRPRAGRRGRRPVRRHLRRRRIRGRARGADLVLADTAGRLHTKTNLMEELRKVRRVADKGDRAPSPRSSSSSTPPPARTACEQARQFTEATEVTGVVLTKLDGSAKGGIVFAIQSELGIPVKLVGLGETAADLVDFDADEFVDALFDQGPDQD